MPKLIMYDNFRTQVLDEEVAMPDGTFARMRCIVITDHDTQELHKFAIPVEQAKQIGAALQGNSVVTAPAGALSDLEKMAPPPGANGKG